MAAETREALLAFLEGAGWGGATLAPLPGDASTRRYMRVQRNGRKAMLMDQPQNAEAVQCPADATPEQRHALGYNAVARLAGADCGRFIAAATFLRSKGLSAPAIYDADVTRGLVLIEDFGDDLYADVLDSDPSSEQSLYAAAMESLAELHACPAPQALSAEKQLFRYDETALLAETDLLTEWFFPVRLGRPATEDERGEHRGLWRAALRNVLAAPPVFVHRDFHAQNLFWLPARQGAARVGLIDFQDAVAGAASYDIISLLEDARRDVPAELAEAMTQRYIAEMKKRGSFDEDAYRAEAAVMAAQRNTKIAGIFARLFKRDGKARYLSYLPRVWRYLERDLAHPSLQPLKLWYDRKIPAEARHQLRVGEAA